jgi:hypothetical protein
MGQVSYQWLSDGVAINGATSASLTLGQAQVVLTISDAGEHQRSRHGGEAVIQRATSAVRNVNDAPTGDDLWGGDRRCDPDGKCGFGGRRWHGTRCPTSGWRRCL